MNFTAIDFETAHANFPCEIGLAKVENGIVTKSESWLIKPACFPYMNPWNERVHGISSAELATEHAFDELWSQIKPYLEDQFVVAHNAAFDMKVLAETLRYYDIAFPHIDYFCSVSLSRKVWKHLPKHSLGALSEFLDIQFNHHRAGDDARACAIITLKAFEKLNTETLEKGIGESGIKLKKLIY
ncbi:MAG: 3'-5' exonuclease [Paludibacter sp.]|nr:3'-5' exonuclease [Paludibacter sp.]